MMATDSSGHCDLIFYVLVYVNSAVIKLIYWGKLQPEI